MTTISNNIVKICKNLQETDDFFSVNDLQACKTLAADNQSVFDKNIQDFIFNSKGFDKDEWENYKERCKSKMIDLKKNYNIENKNSYYNCLFDEDVNTFAETIFGNRRKNFVKQNLDKYDTKKIEYDNLEKALFNTLNRAPSTINENELNKKMEGIESLNNQIENEIKVMKKNILTNYKDKEQAEYDELVKNFRIIDANNKVISNMKDNINYIEKKNEIIDSKYSRASKYLNMLIVVFVFLLILNIFIATYLFS